MTAPELDPILVAADWLPRLPMAARGMLITLMWALEREQAQHAISRGNYEQLRGLYSDILAERDAIQCQLADELERARPRLRVAVDAMSPRPDALEEQGAPVEEPAP